MPRNSTRIPSYRLHKSSGQARVIIDGRHIYLGKYGTEQSREMYNRLIAEWLAAGAQAATPTANNLESDDPLVVSELIVKFWKHAEQRYRKNGEPTSEIRSYKVALRPVAALYGRQAVTDFGPLALVACRQQLIDAGICRKRINQHVSRIRKVFKWGVAREMVPQSVWYALSAVEGLRRGEALETEPIRPANEEHVLAIEPFVTPQIWAMVQFQLWTACRPGEVCRLRTIDLKIDEADWEYRPHTHKVEHHGKERIVFIGPHAQEVITPWLKTDLHDLDTHHSELAVQEHPSLAAQQPHGNYCLRSRPDHRQRVTELPGALVCSCA